MAFYAGQVIKDHEMGNPTLIILTDRNDLDDQLFGTFSACYALLRQRPQQATSREELKTLLTRNSGGVIFTTIQKFSPDEGNIYPLLTDRRNVVIVADEAHRSQYGFQAKVDAKTAEVSYGFAKYLRDALPNASFIGFTGTPIEAADVNTPAVFGPYIDVYDINRAVEDGATVPIYYESRLIRVELNEEGKKLLDEYSEEDDDQSLRTRLLEKLVGSTPRLSLLANDLITHFERRQDAMRGKGMVVCMSRRIAVDLYNKLIELRPHWHHDTDQAGAVKVVMSGDASDPAEWQPHIGKRPKARRDLLAKRTKDPNDELKLVIVCDMWLTGFDAPCMHTMYVDKPLRGHNLMQAIARVNRVFKNKPAGLVVDFIGIAHDLQSALAHYANADRQHTGIDEEDALQLLREKYDIVREMFAPDSPGGHDYRRVLSPQAGSTEKLAILAGALDWVLTMQQADAEKEASEAGKKKALRRYATAVAELTKAFALASASESAALIRDEVAFFQAVRSALIKSDATPGRSRAEEDFAIQQLVSRAVISTEIVDILQAAGLQSPDISILSDDFLQEIQQMKQKNLALEAMRKLLNGEIRSQGERNVAMARSLSDRLQEAISRYHANAISTVQMLQELVNLAKDIKAARQRGEESQLTPEEIAFYDALAENASAREIMGEPQLRVMAHLLVEELRKTVTVDWMHMESARARVRKAVKAILRKHGYPPDLTSAAIQTVLQQAEVISKKWVAV
jgi:type I restriction enzyme, R subunit